MSTIEYSCGHQVAAHSGQAMPMQCACGEGEIVGARGQFYMSDEMSKKFRKLAMNASLLQAIEEPEPMDDNCPAARIGELGNQVHNLGCDYQNDEDLSDELGQVAVTLWGLAKKAAIRTRAQIEREELLTSIIEDYRKSINSPASTVELNLISDFANYLYEIRLLRRAGE